MYNMLLKHCTLYSCADFYDNSIKILYCTLNIEEVAGSCRIIGFVHCSYCIQQLITID